MCVCVPFNFTNVPQPSVPLPRDTKRSGLISIRQRHIKMGRLHTWSTSGDGDEHSPGVLDLSSGCDERPDFGF